MRASSLVNAFFTSQFALFLRRNGILPFPSYVWWRPFAMRNWNLFSPCKLCNTFLIRFIFQLKWFFAVHNSQSRIVFSRMSILEYVLRYSQTACPPLFDISFLPLVLIINIFESRCRSCHSSLSRYRNRSLCCFWQIRVQFYSRIEEAVVAFLILNVH